LGGEGLGRLYGTAADARLQMILPSAPTCRFYRDKTRGTPDQGGGATVSNNSWVSYNVLSALQAGFASFRFTPRSTDDCVANSRQVGSNQPRLILWMNQ